MSKPDAIWVPREWTDPDWISAQVQRLAEAEALLREIVGNYAGGWRNDPLLESIAKADRFLEGKEQK